MLDLIRSIPCPPFDLTSFAIVYFTTTAIGIYLISGKEPRI